MTKSTAFLCCAFAIMAITINTAAQINQGAVLLGGDFGGSSETRKNGSTITSKQHGLGISPAAGFAIRDNLILGTDLYFSDGKYDGTPPSYDSKDSYRGGGIFLRKYKGLGSSGFSVFLQGRLGYQHYRFTQTGTTLIDDIKRSTFSLNANPGLSYKVSNKLQLETGMGNLLSLSIYSEKQTISAGTISDYHSNGFNLTSSLNSFSSLYIGFRLLLDK